MPPRASVTLMVSAMSSSSRRSKRFSPPSSAPIASSRDRVLHGAHGHRQPVDLHHEGVHLEWLVEFQGIEVACRQGQAVQRAGEMRRAMMSAVMVATVRATRLISSIQSRWRSAPARISLCGVAIASEIGSAPLISGA